MFITRATELASLQLPRIYEDADSLVNEPSETPPLGISVNTSKVRCSSAPTGGWSFHMISKTKLGVSTQEKDFSLLYLSSSFSVTFCHNLCISVTFWSSSCSPSDLVYSVHVLFSVLCDQLSCIHLPSAAACTCVFPVSLPLTCSQAPINSAASTFPITFKSEVPTRFHDASYF